MLRPARPGEGESRHGPGNPVAVKARMANLRPLAYVLALLSLA